MFCFKCFMIKQLHAWIYIQEKQKCLCLLKDMYKIVPCIIICNSLKLETNQISINSQMGEYIIQWNSLLNDIDKLQYNIEWRKSDTRVQPYASILMYKKAKIYLQR